MADLLWFNTSWNSMGATTRRPREEQKLLADAVCSQRASRFGAFDLENPVDPIRES
jgi:hypothetical protein